MTLLKENSTPDVTIRRSLRKESSDSVVIIGSTSSLRYRASAQTSMVFSRGTFVKRVTVASLMRRTVKHVQTNRAMSALLLLLLLLLLSKNPHILCHTYTAADPHDNAFCSAKYTNCSTGSSFQQATTLLSETPVFRQYHVSSVGLEQTSATYAPSFINET